MILLDSHILVWLDAGNRRLGLKARKTIDQALKESTLTVSAITFWEIAMLVDKGRLKLDIAPEVWRSDLIDKGLIEIPLSGEVGIMAAQLSQFHGDPADRMIVATAMVTDSSLITADGKILGWHGLGETIDGSR